MEAAERLIHIKEYYFSSKLKEVRGLVQRGKPIINMGIGSPGFKTSRIGDQSHSGCSSRRRCTQIP